MSSCMDESEEEIFANPSLFLIESYIKREFVIGPIRMSLSVLDPGVDWDTTGQDVWPAADALSNYLNGQISNKVPPFDDKLSNYKALELGAGPGLCGIFLSRYCKLTVLTDADDY